jgi:hypothetical protein
MVPFFNAWFSRIMPPDHHVTTIHLEPVLCTGEQGFRDLQDDEVPPIHPSHSTRARNSC